MSPRVWVSLQVMSNDGVISLIDSRVSVTSNVVVLRL